MLRGVVGEELGGLAYRARFISAPPVGLRDQPILMLRVYNIFHPCVAVNEARALRLTCLEHNVLRITDSIQHVRRNGYNDAVVPYITRTDQFILFYNRNITPCQQQCRFLPSLYMTGWLTRRFSCTPLALGSVINLRFGDNNSAIILQKNLRVCLVVARDLQPMHGLLKSGCIVHIM